MSALGLYPHPVDGISGPWTQGAVRTFQSQHGLPVDGVAGPQTRAALGKRGKPKLGERPMHLGQRGWDVAALQFLLHERGFEPGGFDGGFGPNTENAVRRFQSAAHIGVDGVAGPATLDALRGNQVVTTSPIGPVRFFRPGPGPDRRPLRLDPARTLAHRARLPGAEGDPDPRRRCGGRLLRRPQHGRLRQPRRDQPPARLRELVRAHVGDRRVGRSAGRRADRRSATSARPATRPARTCTSRYATSAPRSTRRRTCSATGQRRPRCPAPVPAGVGRAQAPGAHLPAERRCARPRG